MASSDDLDDEIVLGSVIRMVEEARRRGMPYAGPRSPLTTADFSRLSQRLNCRLDFYRFESDVPAMAWPFEGYYILAINSASEQKDQSFGARHELAHVIREDVDVERPVFLSDQDYQSTPERAADLFAFADLLPASFIRLLKRTGMSWPEITHEVREAIRGYARDWPEDRINDRAMLRLRLYQECRI